MAGSGGTEKEGENSNHSCVSRSLGVTAPEWLAGTHLHTVLQARGSGIFITACRPLSVALTLALPASGRACSSGEGEREVQLPVEVVRVQEPAINAAGDLRGHPGDGAFL